MSFVHSIVSTPDGAESNLVVIVPGQDPILAHSSHPNFHKLVVAVTTGSDDYRALRDLADVSQSISRVFARLTDRISINGGHVTLDGDPVHSSLSDQIVRFYESGVKDWKPLLRFFENVAANPQEHSREQLFDWLQLRDFTITDDGNIVAYKGVAKSTEHGFVSIHSGPGIVDGVPMNGQIPNRIGSVVSIARSLVHHDPAVGCSTGLHVGTYEYAKSFAQGGLLEVHVNPRDVVSVPTDCNWQKIRVCRYAVVNVTDTPYTTPLLGDDVGDDDWGWEDEDGDW